jgi:hypothetical protein
MLTGGSNLPKGKSRTPDYVVKAVDKESGRKMRVGAAWLNDNGTISIDLDVFVVLEGSRRPTINLFPWEESETRGEG